MGTNNERKEAIDFVKLEKKLNKSLLPTTTIVNLVHCTLVIDHWSLII